MQGALYLWKQALRITSLCHKFRFHLAYECVLLLGSLSLVTWFQLIDTGIPINENELSHRGLWRIIVFTKRRDRQFILMHYFSDKSKLKKCSEIIFLNSFNTSKQLFLYSMYFYYLLSKYNWFW